MECPMLENVGGNFDHKYIEIKKTWQKHTIRGIMSGITDEEKTTICMENAD